MPVKTQLMFCLETKFTPSCLLCRKCNSLKAPRRVSGLNHADTFETNKNIRLKTIRPWKVGVIYTIPAKESPMRSRGTMAFSHTSIGRDPLPPVYREISSGKRICSGIRGIASMDNLSFGTPCSTSLSDVTLSAAEKPTLS